MTRITEQLADQILTLVCRIGELKYPGSCTCRDSYMLAYMQSIFRSVMLCELSDQEAQLRETVRILEQKISAMENL